MKIKVAVACRDSWGVPKLVVRQVECSESGIDEGYHYNTAAMMLEDEGYEVPAIFIAIDEVEDSELIAFLERE